MTPSLFSHANNFCKKREYNSVLLQWRMLFKWQILRKEISWNYSMIISTLLNCWISKVVLSCNNLVTLTHCVLEPLELLSITHPSANIVWDSSLRRTSHIHAVYIQLKSEDISYMNIRGSINIRTLEEIPLLILHYFSNLTLVLFLLVRSLLICIAFSITIFLWSSLISFLSFFSFQFLLFFLHVVSVCMYIVTK